jgi:hypothetical protein
MASAKPLAANRLAPLRPFPVREPCDDRDADRHPNRVFPSSEFHRQNAKPKADRLKDYLGWPVLIRPRLAGLEVIGGTGRFLS